MYEYCSLNYQAGYATVYCMNAMHKTIVNKRYTWLGKSTKVIALCFCPRLWKFVVCEHIIFLDNEVIIQ